MAEVMRRRHLETLSLLAPAVIYLLLLFVVPLARLFSLAFTDEGGALSTFDRRLLLASDGLGASLLDTFRRIYLPLSLPGLFGGATFVFLLSLGFFITPALLGGANAITLSMLIASFVTDRLAWSLAAAASLVLLVLVLLALTARALPLEKGVYAK